MTRRFSLAYLTVHGVTPAAQARIAARAGYDFVSFRLCPLGVPGEPDCDPIAPEALRETKRALRETGLSVLDIELARIVRDRDPESYLPVMEAAAELGARYLISSAWTTDRDDGRFIIERYGEICDLAREFGMTVDLEFPTFSRLRSLADAIDVVRAAARPNGGVLVDALYYHFSSCTPADLATLPAGWVHFLHLCDTAQRIPATEREQIRLAREARLYVGEGCIDLGALTAALPAVPLSIELPNARRSAELGHDGHAQRCIETARAYFRQLDAPVRLRRTVTAE